MTAPLAMPAASIAAPAADAAAREREVRSAARQLEGVFMEQLLSVMRQSTGENGMFSGTGASTWGALFDEHVGGAMADAGGIGLADVIASALRGNDASAMPESFSLEGISRQPSPPLGPDLGPVMPNRPASGAALSGATGDLQAVARDMLGEDGVAEQWGREGRLSEGDLASDFVTGEPGSEAAFAVRDARGFEGYYKCNLFALEMTRRAGFEVPLIGRHHGWGYPAPTALAVDAADGSMRAGWARVASTASPESLDSAIVSGRSAFVLVGSEHAGHRGHMGVVERVHDIQRDEDGTITSITFDGWEGRSTGAMHLTRRTWAVAGHRAGPEGRGGLGSIEVLELQRPEAGEALEHPLHSRAPGSVLDRPGTTPRDPTATPSVPSEETSFEAPSDF